MQLHADQPHSATALQTALRDSPKHDLELALEIGVNPTTIWRWKEGKSIPASEATRQAIADALRRDGETEADALDRIFNDNAPATAATVRGHDTRRTPDAQAA